MTEVVSRMNSYASAADGYLLRFLRRQTAPMETAMLSVILDTLGEAATATNIYSAIMTMYADFERAGYDVMPAQREGEAADPKELCDSVWCRKLRLLERLEGDGGEIVYRLTATAQEAIRFMSNVGEAPTQLASSRISDMQVRITRLAAMANPDTEVMREFLYKHMVEAEEAYAQFLENGYTELTQAELIEQADLVTAEIEQATSDMAYVGDFLRGEEQTIISAFRLDERSRLEIVDEYLNQLRRFKSSEIAGRSYQGVLDLLGSPELRRDIDDALEMLSGLVEDEDGKVALLKGRWERLVRASDSVRGIMGKSVTRIDRELRRLESDGVRSYAKVIRNFRAATEEFALAMGPERTGPLSLRAGKAETRSMPYAIAPAERTLAMPSLEEVAEQDPVALENYLGYCAPLTRKVLSQIAAAVGDHQAADIADAFNRLPEHLRRDVEVGALMTVAKYTGTNVEDAAMTEYRCVGADGLERSWMAPKVVVSPDCLRACLEKEDL